MAKDWWEEEDEEEEGGGLSYLKRLRRKSSGKGGVGHYLNEKKADVAATGQTKLSDGTTYRSDKIAGEYNAEQNKEISDMVRGMGDYLTERREAETEPIYRSRRNRSNLLTPEMEAEFQRRSGRGNRLTPFQEYMRATVASMPEQEETRSTDELRRDMNRQNRLARATNRMAADMGNQLLQDQSGIYDPVRSTNLGVMARTMATQQEKADRATELYRTESTRRRWQEEQEKYASLLSNPDFAAKSQGDPTIGNKASSTSLAPAERLYQKIFHRNDTKDANGNIKDAAGSDAARFVSDEEAAIFYYLWNTQGAKAAQSYYYGYVENRAGERRAQFAQQQAQAYGEYDPVGASIARVGYNAMSGIGLVDMALQNLTRALGITDRNKPLNYNSDAQLPGQVADALQSGASNFVEQFAVDEIKRINPNVKHPENYAKVASFLYQTGMSMADSSVAIALNLMGIPEPLTLANMGAAAGTRAIREARERGATDGQALAFGISSAIMEALFEKISLDKILEPSTATKFWPRVKNAIDQMFTEGSEEVMTTLANTAFDQLIMGDKSELFTRQRRLMEQGVSEKEALRAAMLQWGTEVLGDLLGGMISGLGMGGTKEIATGLRYIGADAQTAREMTDVQNREAAEAREQALRTAYEQAPLTIGGRNVTLNENRQEVNNGQGQQAETAASAGEDDFRARAETAAEGARRSYLDRIERSSGLGRLLQDLRNYRIVRGAENRASEVARIRNQAETGNHRKVSALDYGIENGTADMTGVEIDNVTLGKALGRNWTRAVDEFARQGVTLKGITGQLMKADGTQVRAFFRGDGKTIVVQVDNPRLSWNQLLDHEDLHRRIKENPSYRKAVEDALLADKKRQAYLPEIIDRYAQAYARIAPQLSSDDVIEELLADYRAGFDMLDPLGVNPITARAAKAAAKDIRAVEKKGTKGEAAAESEGAGSYSTEIGNQEGDIYGREFDSLYRGTDSGNGTLSKGNGQGENRVRETPAGGTEAAERTGEGTLEAGDQQRADSLKEKAFKENSITPQQGTPEYYMANRAMAKYGIKAVVVKPDVWDTYYDEKTYMASFRGQIYVRQGISKEDADIGLAHETTHIMKQVGYAPYIALASNLTKYFNSTAPMARPFYQEILNHVEISEDEIRFNPRDTAQEKQDKAKKIMRVNDEILSTMYGEVSNNKISGKNKNGRYFDYYGAFVRLDELKQKLDGMHQDFQTWNKNRQNAETGKKSTEIDTDYLAAVNSGDMETAQRMEPTEQNGKPRKDETAWQAYLSRYEREAEKRGADNPLLESQQEGKASTEIGQWQSYELTDEFLREVPNNERHTFLRSLATKTSMMKDGESRNVAITAADHLYLFEADGYMSGFIKEKLDLNTDVERVKRERKEFLNGPDKDAEIADLWSNTVSDYRGESRSGVSVSVQGRGENAGNDKVPGTQFGRDRATDHDGIDDYSDEKINELPDGALYFDGENAYRVGEGHRIEKLDSAEFDSDFGASDAAIEAEANEGKASREVDPNTLNMLNRQDLTTVYRAMQVVNSKPRKDETAWQAYLNRYEREAAELLRIHAAGPKSRDTVWMQCLRRYEEEQRRKEARKIAEISGDVPAEHTQLPVEEPSWIM